MSATAHRDGLREALATIRTVAATHYMGDAFEREHWRELANIAADALIADAALDIPGDEGRHQAALNLPGNTHPGPRAACKVPGCPAAQADLTDLP